MKNFFAWCVRAVAAGILAFVALTCFCFFYYNIPVHRKNETGATDHKWEPDTFYSYGTEGLAYGRTNNEGFINTIDYQQGMPIDILIIGSSHMEAFCVSQNESTTGKLKASLPDMTVYNIGISGHTFLTCCCNLNDALKTYHPQKYVIIETTQLVFSDEELQSAIDGTVPELSVSSSGVLNVLSGNPCLRLAFRQLRLFLGKYDDEAQDGQTTDAQELVTSTSNLSLLDRLLTKISDACKSEGTQLIIFYHPVTELNADGSLRLPNDAATRDKFNRYCNSNGIYFLDMTERFSEEYSANHVLPYGFTNTSIGSGHLNKYGHAMVADELVKIIHEVR